MSENKNFDEYTLIDKLRHERLILDSVGNVIYQYPDDPIQKHEIIQDFNERLTTMKEVLNNC